jgi:plastocyanin
MTRYAKFMTRNKQKIAVSIVAPLLIASTVAITIGMFALSSSSKAAELAQQNSVIAAFSPGTARTFYLFNSNHDGVNQTKLGIAPDAYSPETLTVNTGDTVDIHFYNVDTTDRHSFTMAGAYNVDVDLAPGQHSVVAFKASHQGVFGFFCKYHPTMTGQLVVLPPPPFAAVGTTGT